MHSVRRADDRGHVQLDWLDSRHTFSFGHYYDPRFMGFSTLRVINDDHIAPGGGFPMHGHQDMEIITYMISGTLAHKDSMGNEEVIRPGEIQRMSAGTGVRHSEFNASQTEPAHLLQIWIQPGTLGRSPGYEQKFVRDVVQPGKMGLVVAPEGEGGALTMHTDARLYAGVLDAGAELQHSLPPGRSAWLHVVQGSLAILGEMLHAGDALALKEEEALSIRAHAEAEFLLFDLP